MSDRVVARRLNATGDIDIWEGRTRSRGAVQRCSAQASGTVSTSVTTRSTGIEPVYNSHRSKTRQVPIASQVKTPAATTSPPDNQSADNDQGRDHHWAAGRRRAVIANRSWRVVSRMGPTACGLVDSVLVRYRRHRARWPVDIDVGMPVAAARVTFVGWDHVGRLVRFR